ncbi:protein rep [Myroides odoratimimus]|uniref:protein rep n=1 Tax=Myroides odoratimimus TaxID=76832 RepID=UPI0025782DE8|nr:protein rep [Myroides odoratimimus]
MANIQKNGDSQSTPIDILKKRQWSKFVSKGIALSLMHYNSKSDLFKSYKNSSYCSEVLRTDENCKLTSTYCKTKWCLTCGRIRTGRLINAYYFELESLKNPVFVTLTLPTVLGEDLPKRIAEMEKEWRLIYQITKKAKYKSSFECFKGVRKAECTIRPNGHYHYHFHFILEGYEQGKWLIDEWLKRFPKANKAAQNIKIVSRKNNNAYNEIFKYAFKSEVKASNKMNAERYDLVFRALKGKRTIQAFGGIKSISEDFSDEDLKNGITLEGRPNEILKWCMDDWYGNKEGEALVGLAIPEKVKNLTNYPKDKVK